MNKGFYFIVVTLLLLTSAQAEEKLLFSVEKREEYTFLQTQYNFTILESGKYDFKTNTGGFQLCSGQPAGKFSGELDPAKLKKIKKLFFNLEDECKKLETCETKVDIKKRNHFAWSISGWGDYADRTYYFSGLTKAPKFFEYLFSIEKDLYQEKRRTLSLIKKEETAETIRLELRYDSRDKLKQTVVKNLEAFMVLRGNELRRLETDSEMKVIEYEGHAHLIHSLNKEKYNLRPGDQIIYLPSKTEGLNPCIEISN